MEKMLDKKSRDFAKNMRDKMIYDKSKNEVQIGTNLYVDGKITSATPSEGGKVYLHNIYINGSKSGCMKIYTANNEPFTKNTLQSFMYNNGITSREKGFPLCYASTIESENNISKVLNFNYVAFYGNGVLSIGFEKIEFNFTDNNVTLTKNIMNTTIYPSSITDTVIEL